MPILLRACVLGILLCTSPLSNLAVGLATFIGGNAPIEETPYADWPKIMLLINDEARVFHAWVNGHEGFYFKGNVQALNKALRNFSQVDLPEREVVLVPEPGVVEHRKKAISYTWSLRLRTGIAKHKIEPLMRGVRVLAKAPTIYVCVDDDLDLSELQIPDRVTVVGPPNRQRKVLRPSETPEDRAVAEQRHVRALEKIDAFLAERNERDAEK
jgi:hypothetical protein